MTHGYRRTFARFAPLREIRRQIHFFCRGAAFDSSPALMVFEELMRLPCTSNCRTVGRTIAHCEFHITHCLAERSGPTAFPLPINAPCVMRNGQWFFPLSGFRHAALLRYLLKDHHRRA